VAGSEAPGDNNMNMCNALSSPIKAIGGRDPNSIQRRVNNVNRAYNVAKGVDILLDWNKQENQVWSEYLQNAFDALKSTSPLKLMEKPGCAPCAQVLTPGNILISPTGGVAYPKSNLQIART
jgi:hypothetical protein